jgi:hypothetical protein
VITARCALLIMLFSSGASIAPNADRDGASLGNARDAAESSVLQIRCQRLFAKRFNGEIGPIQWRCSRTRQKSKRPV